MKIEFKKIYSVWGRTITKHCGRSFSFIMLSADNEVCHRQQWNFILTVKLYRTYFIYDKADIQGVCFSCRGFPNYSSRYVRNLRKPVDGRFLFDGKKNKVQIFGIIMNRNFSNSDWSDIKTDLFACLLSQMVSVLSILINLTRTVRLDILSTGQYRRWNGWKVMNAPYQ